VSVFLYVAIIGIWLFILVPRWLKRSRDAQAAAEETARLDAEYEAQQYEAAQYEAAQYEAAQYEAVRYEATPDQAAYYVEVSEYESVQYEAAGSGTDAGRARLTAPPGARRTRVLQARRRLLTILVTLMAVAAACVVLKRASWVALVPPAIMLGVYLLLLREAAVADAETARRREFHEAQAYRAEQHAETRRAAEDEQYSAQIIDISARVGDQLYDQYADATVRAVGD